MSNTKQIPENLLVSHYCLLCMVSEISFSFALCYFFLGGTKRMNKIKSVDYNKKEWNENEKKS